jgi:hypothetical protein
MVLKMEVVELFIHLSCCMLLCMLRAISVKTDFKQTNKKPSMALVCRKLVLYKNAGVPFTHFSFLSLPLSD